VLLNIVALPSVHTRAATTPGLLFPLCRCHAGRDEPIRRWRLVERIRLTHPPPCAVRPAHWLVPYPSGRALEVGSTPMVLYPSEDGVRARAHSSTSRTIGRW